MDFLRYILKTDWSNYQDLPENDASRPKVPQTLRGGLGRDDPVWPVHVQETEKWDADLIRSWNTNMDVLLVFVSFTYKLILDVIGAEISAKAALFSAVVTAFLIESSKDLKEDPAKVSASAAVETLNILRAMATGDHSYPNDSSLVSSGAFEPTRGDIIVNVLWYLSLSLSLATALVAMLVKQWCNAFLSGRLGTPCVQSRTRQARYDKLIGWNTNTIVLSMPIVLHIALVCFMAGLSVYLKALNYLVYRFVVAVFSLTAAFYGVTTLLALFVPFCPFHNALSSVCQGGLAYIYWLFFEDESRDPLWFDDAIWPRLSSKIQEDRLVNSTTPDEVTGRAIHWLITSSQSPESSDKAIQSIARVGSASTMETLLNAKPIMALVAQRFTSCFREATNIGTALNLDLNEEFESVVALYGQALANLAAHVTYKHLPEEKYDDLLVQEQRIDAETVDAVARRFQYLSGSQNSRKLVALGLAGASAWNEFCDYSGQRRFNRGAALLQLCEFACVEVESPQVPPMVTHDLFRALVIETAHWSHDINHDDRAKILALLVRMMENTAVPCVRSLLATSLAVVVTAINKLPPSVYFMSSRRTRISFEGQMRSRIMAHQYTKRERLRTHDSDALLLLGLTGLLEAYEGWGIEEGDEQTIRSIANQLFGLSIFDRNERIHLSTNVLPHDFDIRIYALEVVARLFSDDPYLSGKYLLSEVTRATLLRSLVNKLHVWSSRGTQIIRPVLHMLNHAIDDSLRTQCLEAMGAYWLVAQPPSAHWRIYLHHHIPYKLVEIVSVSGAASLLGALAIADFESFTRQMYQCGPHQFQAGQANVSPVDTDLVFQELRLITLGGLFNGLDEILLGRRSLKREHVEMWERARRLWVSSLGQVGEDPGILATMNHYLLPGRTGFVALPEDAGQSQVIP